jgi:hypothetical protein
MSSYCHPLDVILPLLQHIIHANLSQKSLTSGSCHAAQENIVCDYVNTVDELQCCLAKTVGDNMEVQQHSSYFSHLLPASLVVADGHWRHGRQIWLYDSMAWRVISH